jgi:uncharacterized membrane protein
MGRAATLLIILCTVTTPIICMIGAFVLRWLQNMWYFMIVYSILSFAGYILFLVAMHRLANHYGDRAIFRNSLYGFVTAVVGAIVFILIIYGVSSALLYPLIETLPTSGTHPPVMTVVFPFFVFIATILVGAFIIALIQSLFYRRAFYALAEKSGENNFRQAGFFMLLGGALTIVLVGALLFFVGWIFAALGFFAMKARSPQVYPLPSPQSPIQAVQQKKRCSICGAENTDNAIYCSQCGNKL